MQTTINIYVIEGNSPDETAVKVATLDTNGRLKLLNPAHDISSIPANVEYHEWVYVGNRKFLVQHKTTNPFIVPFKVDQNSYFVNRYYVVVE